MKMAWDPARGEWGIQCADAEMRTLAEAAAARLSHELDPNRRRELLNFLAAYHLTRDAGIRMRISRIQETP